MNLLVVGRCIVSSFALSLLLYCCTIEAKTYFVSPQGLDSNPGTSVTAPLRSIGCAASNMVAGDVCLIRGGTYRETLRPTRSGSPTAPLIFEAYGEEEVVITGADLITNWTASATGVYTSGISWDLGEGCNQVFVDDTMIHQARLPTFGTGDLLHPATVAVTVDNKNDNNVSSPAWGGHPANFFAGAWFSAGVGDRWSWQTARVLSSSGNTVTLDSKTKSNPWFQGGGIGFLWGLRGFLTADNQWHLDSHPGSNTLLLRITGGADPSLHQVEVKRRAWCIDFNNRSYLSVRGLHFQAGAVCLNGHGNTLENCRGRFLSHFMNYTWGYAFDGDRLPGGGVVLSGTNNTVRGCTIYDTAGSGIFITGSSNFITRNLIYATDYSGTYACPVKLNGCQNRVLFNTAHYSGRDILHCAGAGHTVSFNNFFDPGVMCRDLGVIYTWGDNAQCSDGTRTRIAYNWLHDNTESGGPTPLIYLDNWCRNFVVDHNVLWNSKGDSGIRINAPADGHFIYNNTLFQCDPIATHTYDMWPANNPDSNFWTSDQYNFSSVNNLFLGTQPQSALIAPVNLDFRLKPAAAAAQTGMVIHGYTQNRTPPCGLGAYETGRPFWKPGVDGWFQPRLAITRIDSGNLLLTGPPGAAYFQLETAITSGADKVWAPVTNSPTVSNKQWSVKLPVSENEQRYFRLKAK